MDVEFEASVRSMIGVAGRQAQTFGLRVDVPINVAKDIAAGQFSDATISVSEQRRSLFVLRHAVVSRSEGNFVLMVNEENVAPRVDVQVGSGQGAMVAIQGDLRV